MLNETTRRHNLTVDPVLPIRAMEFFLGWSAENRCESQSGPLVLIELDSHLLVNGFLPVTQRVRKNPRQFLSVSRSRRELSHPVLR